MDWKDAVVGARIVVRVDAGFAGRPPVEIAGELLGRGRFDALPAWAERDAPELGARVRLDDGSILTVPMTALVRRG